MLLSDLKEIKNGRYIMKDADINISINLGTPEVKIEQPEGVNVASIEAKEDVIYSDDILYKGYTMKQIPATGGVDIFAVGGAIIQHAESYELAKTYIDNLGQ